MFRLVATHGCPASMTETNHSRPLEWRDLPLLHRLRQHGLCFDSIQAYTRGPHPLQSALLDAVRPGRSDSTWVAPHASKRALTAIGQVSYPPGARVGRLAFVAPEAAISQDNMLHLLESLATAVGRRGGHHLIAEVNEDNPAFERLRQAGFAVYARQRVWCRPAEAQPPTAGAADRWRSNVPDDELAIQRLYWSLVPALVQQVESPPAGSPAGLVHWSGDELHGYLDLDHGPLGVWVQPYFHPAVSDHADLLAAAFGRLAERHQQPIYVCVRSYQGWMNASLDAMGFQRTAAQAVMVKRLVARVQQAVELPLPSLEATRAEPTAPITSSTIETPPYAGAEPPTP
jgi:hypothetical protein